MGTSKTREFKINFLITRINIADDRGISLNKKRLLNELCICGYTQMRTAEEILELLINTNRVYLVGEDLLGPILFNELQFKQSKQLEL
jgi:hypothetical protein